MLYLAGLVRCIVELERFTPNATEQRLVLVQCLGFI